MGIISKDNFLLPVEEAQPAVPTQPPAPVGSVSPKQSGTLIGKDDFYAIPDEFTPGQFYAGATGAARNIIPSIAGLVSGTIGGLGGAAVGGPAAPVTGFTAAVASSAAGAYGAAELQNAAVPPSLKEQFAAMMYPKTYTRAGMAPGFLIGRPVTPKHLLTKAGAQEAAIEASSEFGGDLVINTLTGQQQNLGESLGQAGFEALLQGRQTGLGRTISQAPINLGSYLLGRPTTSAPALTPEAQARILAEANGQPAPVAPAATPAPQAQGFPIPVPGVTPAEQAPAPVVPTVAAPVAPAPAVPTPAPVAQAPEAQPAAPVPAPAQPAAPTPQPVAVQSPTAPVPQGVVPTLQPTTPAPAAAQPEATPAPTAQAAPTAQPEPVPAPVAATTPQPTQAPVAQPAPAAAQPTRSTVLQVTPEYTAKDPLELSAVQDAGQSFGTLLETNQTKPQRILDSLAGKNLPLNKAEIEAVRKLKALPEPARKAALKFAELSSTDRAIAAQAVMGWKLENGKNGDQLKGDTAEGYIKRRLAEYTGDNREKFAGYLRDLGLGKYVDTPAPAQATQPAPQQQAATPAQQETPVAPQQEAVQPAQPTPVQPAAQAPQGQEAATPATPGQTTQAAGVEPTQTAQPKPKKQKATPAPAQPSTEPSEVQKARDVVNNNGKGVGERNYERALRVVEQYENDQKLARYERPDDFAKVSDEAIEDFLAKHDARTEYEQSNGIESDPEQEAFAQRVRQYYDRRQEFAATRGNLAQDLRSLASEYGLRLPTIPKWYKGDHGRGFSDAIKHLAPEAFGPPPLLRKWVGAEQMKDPKFQEQVIRQIDSMVERFAQGLAGLGWTQVDPSNVSSYDAMLKLLNDAGKEENGGTAVPQGGVNGSSVRVGRLYTPQAEGTPTNSEDPFSRRDQVEEGDLFGPKQVEFQLDTSGNVVSVTPADGAAAAPTPAQKARKAKAVKQAKEIAANAATPPVGGEPTVDRVHLVDVNGTFSNVVEHVVVDRVRSGVEKIKTPADMAHAMAEWFNSRAQENLAVVVLDKDGRILNVARSTIGGPNFAQFLPAMLAGQALSVKGGHSVWLMHNHPSGTDELSSGDIGVSGAFNNILAGAGLKYEGIMAIANGKFAYFDQENVRHVRGRKIPQMERKFQSPITERIFSQRGTLLDEQLVKSHSDTAQTANLLLGGKTGVLLINTRAEPIGTIEMTTDQMLKLRQPGVLDNFLRAVDRTNAYGFVAYTGDADAKTSAAVEENLSKLTNATSNASSKFYLHDVVDKAGDTYKTSRFDNSAKDFDSRTDTREKTKAQIVSEANRLFREVDKGVKAEAFGGHISEFEFDGDLLDNRADAADAVLEIARQVEASAPDVARRLREIVNPPERNPARDGRKADELDRRIATNIQNRARNPEGRRGYQGIVDRAVFEARKNGQISEKEVEGLTRILNMVGKQFFKDVKLSIREGEGGQLGQYAGVQRIVTIFKDAIRTGRFEDTAAHEVAHHLSQFLPEADRVALRKEWSDARAKFLKANPGFAKLVPDATADWTKVRIKGTDLQRIAQQHPELKSKGYFTQIPGKGEPMYRVSATDETYRLFNSSEWFAETFKDVVRKRLDSDPVYTENPATWKDKLVQLWEAIKTQFRQMFGKDQAARILSNFAKGRYEAVELGGVDIDSRGREVARSEGVTAPDGEAANHGDADLAGRGFITKFAAGANLPKDATIEIVDNGQDYERGGFKVYDAQLRIGGEDAGLVTFRAQPEVYGEILDIEIPEAFRGNKYSEVLYAEIGERLRRDGIEDLRGSVIDQLGRPIAAREAVFGKGSTEVIDVEEDYNGEGDTRREVATTIDQSRPLSQRDEAALAALPKDAPLNEENGEQVLNSIRDESTAGNPDADLMPPAKPNHSLQRKAADIVSFRYFSGLSAKAHQNAARNPGSATAKAVANIIHARPGTKSDAFERDLPTAIQTKRTEFQNRFNEAMSPLRKMLGGFRDSEAGSARDQREQVYRALTDMITGRRDITDGDLGRAAQSLKTLLADLHAYRTEAGEKLGNVNDYYPAVYDSLRIGENREAFVKDATRAYQIELNKLSDEDLAKEAGVLPEDLQPALPGFPGYDRKALLEQVSKAKAEALFRVHQLGGDQDMMSVFGSPDRGGAENPSMSRVFSREAQTILSKWQVADPFRVVGRYMGNSVKRAELVRRFGNDGKKWGEMARAMIAEGVDQSTVDEMRDLVRIAAGIGIPPRGRTEQGVLDTVTMLTAASAMGRGFLNNLVEPVSMGIRTGSPTTMLRAYAETWGRFLREVPSLSPAIQEKLGKTFWQDYGEQIGTIHNSIEDAWMTTHSMDLDGDEADPRMRWLTNRIYKANLMDASENAKQQASHAIGYGFIKDLARWSKGEHWMNKAFGVDPKQSVTDQLNELGVPLEKHAEFADWVLALDKSKGDDLMARMTENSEMALLHREAMTRFSYQSSVRSSRAHRPVFQDNALGKTLLQLMNFSYSYAAEVNSRVYDMAVQSVKSSPEGKDYNMADRVRLLGPAVGALFAVAAYRGLLELKDLLYPSEGSEKRAKDPQVVKWANAASYAGVFGPKFEQAMKYIKRDQVPGGPVGQIARNVGRAGATALDSIAEGKDMGAAGKQAVKAAIPLVKGGVVAGASAASPVLGAAAVQATNTTGWSNALTDAAGADKGKGQPKGYAPKDYNK